MSDGPHRNLDNLADEVRASQKNIAFPDTVRNGRSVDAFLWKGSPNPPLVQRIGAWMFGTMFVGLGLALFSFAQKALAEEHDWIGFGMIGFISLSSALVGMKIFRNGFPRRKR